VPPGASPFPYKRNLMKNTIFTLLIFTALNCSTTAAFSVDTPSPHPQTENIAEPQIIATVNNIPIYSDRLNINIKKSLKKYKKYGMKEASPDLMYNVQKKALDKEIGNELIRQESRKLKITDIDKKAEDKYLSIRNKYPDETVFNRYLEMRNLTVEKMKANLRKSVYVDEYLLKHNISDPEIPKNILRSFYDSNPNNYHIDEAIKVSHILIKVADNATEKDTKKAYKKAVKIRKSILKGNDFAETAIDKSECNSASGGGDLRYIKRGYMPKEFEDAAFALEIDKISKVVKTKYGYHIIKVSEKIPEGTVPFEDTRDFIKKYFQMDETKKRLNEHIAKLREKAEIEVLLPQN
jgi:peptidyl-prolyl cis-trans isomerase C